MTRSWPQNDGKALGFSLEVVNLCQPTHFCPFPFVPSVRGSLCLVNHFRYPPVTKMTKIGPQSDEKALVNPPGILGSTHRGSLVQPAEDPWFNPPENIGSTHRGSLVQPAGDSRFNPLGWSFRQREGLHPLGILASTHRGSLVQPARDHRNSILPPPLIKLPHTKLKAFLKQRPY